MAERPYRSSHPISLRIPSDLSRILPRARSVLAAIEHAVAPLLRPDSGRSARLQPGPQPVRASCPNVGHGQIATRGPVAPIGVL